MAPRKRPALQRFEAFFVRPDDPSACWEWLGSRRPNGYGQFGMGKGVIQLAHRSAYELYCGEIAPGLHVLHRCDNKGCVNPSHLELGTHQKNMADAWKRGRYGPNVKLSPDAAALIFQSKARTRDLAKEFGVSRHHIGSIRAGRRGHRLLGVDEVRPRKGRA